LMGLAKALKSVGLRLVSPNFDVGDHPYDIDFDTPPYMVSGKPHLKLEIGGHICTSMLLIVEKPGRSKIMSRVVSAFQRTKV
jgi:hypothetical protein